MSITSEIERIKNAKTTLKSSIENKGVSVGDGLINTYASKVDEIVGGGNYNSYKVETIQERDALEDIKDGDICVVQQSNIAPVTEEVATNGFDSVLISDTIVLDNPITDFYYCSLADDNYTVELSVEVESTTARINYRNMEGDIYYNWMYSSQDGITYTLNDSSEPIGNYDFGTKIHWQNSGDSWNDVFGYFLQTGSVNFEGIYKANVENDVVTWNYLDIGISPTNSDILLNKKAYTNNGTITGTRDMNEYALLNFKVSATQPSDPENSAVWIKPYDFYWNLISADNQSYLAELRKCFLVPYDTSIAKVKLTTIPTTANLSTYSTKDHKKYKNYMLFFLKDNTNMEWFTYNLETKIKTIITPSFTYDINTNFIITSTDDGNFYIRPTKRNTTIKSLYKFNILTNTWTTLASCPEENSNCINTTYHRKTNSLICMGYYTSISYVYVYNIANNTWTKQNKSVYTTDELKCLCLTQENTPSYFGDYTDNNNLYYTGSLSYIYEETTNAYIARTVVWQQVPNIVTAAESTVSYHYKITQMYTNDTFIITYDDLGYTPEMLCRLNVSNNKLILEGIKVLPNLPRITTSGWSGIGLLDYYYDSNSNKYYRVFAQPLSIRESTNPLLCCQEITNYFNNYGVPSSYYLSIALSYLYGGQYIYSNVPIFNSQYSYEITKPKITNAVLLPPESGLKNILLPNTLVEKIYIYAQGQYKCIIDHLHNWEELTSARILYIPQTITLSVKPSSDNISYDLINVDNSNTICGSLTYNALSDNPTISIVITDDNLSLQITYTDNGNGLELSNVSYNSKAFGTNSTAITLPFNISVGIDSGKVYESWISDVLKYIDE